MLTYVFKKGIKSFLLSKKRGSIIRNYEKSEINFVLSNIFYMKVSEFKLLNENEQFDIIEQHGVFLAERESSFYNIRLYQVQSFYVELYCHTHFNVIVRSKIFSGTHSLTPYLNAIDIEALLAD